MSFKAAIPLLTSVIALSAGTVQTAFALPPDKPANGGDGTQTGSVTSGGQKSNYESVVKGTRPSSSTPGSTAKSQNESNKRDQAGAANNCPCPHGGPGPRNQAAIDRAVAKAKAELKAELKAEAEAEVKANAAKAKAEAEAAAARAKAKQNNAAKYPVACKLIGASLCAVSGVASGGRYQGGVLSASCKVWVDEKACDPTP